MKAYVVWHDNGESYEDNYQDIHKIFTTYELAEEYLNRNYEKIIPDYGNKNPYWKEKLYICSQGKDDSVDCQDCPKYWDSKNYDGSIFIDDDGKQTNECPEEFYIDGNYYNNLSIFTIEEVEILDSIDKAFEKEIDISNEETEERVSDINMYDSTNVKLNSKSVNKCITYTILSDEEMKALGFHKNDNNWYYCKVLKKDSCEGRDASITLNITLPIPIDNDKLDISVLDEAFLQPYDFQSILNRNPNIEYALKIANLFEDQMDILSENGVIHGHKRGEYV